MYDYGLEDGEWYARNKRRGQTTTGNMFFGKNGMLEIVVPVAEFGLAGRRPRAGRRWLWQALRRGAVRAGGNSDDPTADRRSGSIGRTATARARPDRRRALGAQDQQAAIVRDQAARGREDDPAARAPDARQATRRDRKARVDQRHRHCRAQAQGQEARAGDLHPRADGPHAARRGGVRAREGADPPLIQANPMSTASLITPSPSSARAAGSAAAASSLASSARPAARAAQARWTATRTR